MSGKRGRIVVLNGVGSAGKTTIARALQTIAATPLLHVEMDAFLGMLPASYENHPDAFSYLPVGGDGPASLSIRSGPVGRRLMAGMNGAVAALAEAGNDLVVDTVLIGPDKRAFAAALAPFDVNWVGIVAPLAVLEERERRRGDRLPGLARWQFGRVHDGMDYDFTVDTSRLPATACAEAIRARLGL